MDTVGGSIEISLDSFVRFGKIDSCKPMAGIGTDQQTAVFSLVFDIISGEFSSDDLRRNYLTKAQDAIQRFC